MGSEPTKVPPYLGPLVTIGLAIVAAAIVWGGAAERVQRLDKGLDRLEEINQVHVRDHTVFTGNLADHAARIGALERSRRGHSSTQEAD